MSRWVQLRTPVLMIACFGILSVLAKVIFIPTAAQRVAPATLSFPSNIPLPGWEFVASRPLTQNSDNKQVQKKLLASKLYEYQQGNLPIQIEMRYAIETSGNVMGFLRTYTSIPIATIQPALRNERHQDEVGYYLVFVNEQRAYLTSCINPRGDSTVTLPQFRRNRYLYDLRVERLMRWLVYSEGIRDDRCLWTNMSVPLKNNSPEAAYTVLETVWMNWYRWWQPQFPQS